MDLEDEVAIYFEVLDPDEPSEDTYPGYFEYKIPTEYPPVAFGFKDAVDNEPNDNHDPARTMYAGSLAQYETFQNNCLSARSATTVPSGTGGLAEVTLTITDRYAGDNYIVRATCIDPEGKPFNEKSKVTGAEHAGISEGCIVATTPLTAWKRIYVETDQMFRVGAYLSDDSGVSHPPANVIRVPTDDLDLAPGDTIQILDRDNQTTPFGEIRTVQEAQANAIIVTQDLTQDYSYGITGRAAVGKLTDASDGVFVPFYEANTADIAALFATAYVDVRFEPIGSGPVPFVPAEVLDSDIQLTDFSRGWFRNKEKRNYFHVIGAHASKNQNRLGVALWGKHWCCVFVQRIEDLFLEERWARVNKSVTVHELTHQFNEEPEPLLTDGEYHHPTNQPGVVPEAGGVCVMSNGRDHWAPSRWCLYHVHAVRDQDDPQVYS